MANRCWRARAAAGAVVSIAALTLIAGCGTDAKCRADLAKLKREVENLREKLQAIEATVNDPQRGAWNKDHPRQRVTVIGGKADKVRITITVDAIRLHGRPVKMTTLTDYLAHLAASDPHTPVVVTSVVGVPPERVVEIVDAIKQAGLKQLSITGPAAR